MLDGYQAFIMLPARKAPSIDRVREQLQQVFDRVDATARIETAEPNCLNITISPGASGASEDWQMRVYANHDPSVLTEAQEIAAAHMESDDPRKSALATYDFRIEIGCDPDPTMDRFNYYVHVLESLSTFPGAIVFDPTTTGFIE
jgi:hypothetical protein